LPELGQLLAVEERAGDEEVVALGNRLPHLREVRVGEGGDASGTSQEGGPLFASGAEHAFESFDDDQRSPAPDGGVSHDPHRRLSRAELTEDLVGGGSVYERRGVDARGSHCQPFSFRTRSRTPLSTTDTGSVAVGRLVSSAS
jgi:hypothetical protein